MSGEQLPHLETFARAAELSSFTAAATCGCPPGWTVCCGWWW